MGERRADRQSGRGFYLVSLTTWRAGDDAFLYHHKSDASWHGHFRPALQLPGLVGLDEVLGGTPYGASTLAGPDGSRPVHETEREGARFLGEHVAKLAGKLA